MRTTVNSLILISVLASSLAQAGDDQRSPGSAEIAGDKVFFPSQESDADIREALGMGPEKQWNPDARKTVIKLHPAAAAAGLALSALSSTTILMLPVELEHAVGPNVSLYGMAVPMFMATRLQSVGGIGLNGGVRAYFSGNAPDGFWLGGQVNATLLASSSVGGISFDLQPQVGYQWILENGFTIGLGGGLSLGALMNAQPALTWQVPIGFAW